MLTGTRVAYVDHDLEVIDQVKRALDGEGDRSGVSVACSDIRDPAAVLTTLSYREAVRLDRPAAVILALVLKFMTAAQAEDLTAG